MEIRDNNAILGQMDDGGILMYCGWVDSIHKFEDDRMDHVKFWDNDTNKFSYQFLDQSVLKSLALRGIPEVRRQFAYRAEADAQYDSCWQEAEEIREFRGTDFILGQIASEQCADLISEIEDFLGGQ